MRQSHHHSPASGLLNWFCNQVWPHIDRQRHILGIQLDITNACNLRCTHCYHAHHNNAGALTLAQWVQVLDQYAELLKKLRMQPRITVCGGEPFTSSDLFPLIEQIRQRFRDADLYILTNGTLLDDAHIRHLHKHTIRLQVSLDGPDAQRHDLTRGSGSFEKTLHSCRMLHAAHIPFHHLAVLSRRTAQWIPNFFQRATDTRAASMNFARLIAMGMAATPQDGRLDAPLAGTDLRDAMSRIIECSKNSGIPTHVRGPLWHLVPGGQGLPSDIGMSGFVIGYNGAFKVSSRTPATLGNILAESMEELFLHHPVMTQLRKGQISICSECIHFNICRGDRNASFAAYGHFFGPDPGCWLPTARANQQKYVPL